MSFAREAGRAIRSTLVLWVITALIYPFSMIAIGQILFPWQANGSLISGASNLAPSNPLLIDRIKGKPDPDPQKALEGEIPRLEKATIKPTADLVYTSGSSLDPHITPEAARAQIERVALSRGLPTNQVEILVTKNTDDRFLGIFGEPGVNLLKLNLALDAIANSR